MIDALVSGHIFDRPTRRVGKSGKPFVTAKVRAGMRNGEAAFINLIAFTETVMTGLMALDNAAAVAVSGELTTNLWNDRDGKPHAGLDMVAHAILTAHHVDRRRKAARDQPLREPTGGADPADPFEGEPDARTATQERGSSASPVFPGSAALAHHAHQEIAEAVVQLLDVSEHPHGRMVPSERGERPCSVQQTRLLYVCGSGRDSAVVGMRRMASHGPQEPSSPDVRYGAAKRRSRPRSAGSGA